MMIMVSVYMMDKSQKTGEKFSPALRELLYKGAKKENLPDYSERFVVYKLNFTTKNLSEWRGDLNRHDVFCSSHVPKYMEKEREVKKISSSELKETKLQ